MLYLLLLVVHYIPYMLLLGSDGLVDYYLKASNPARNTTQSLLGLCI